MSMRGTPVSFRPTPEVADWLEAARKAGFSPADVINSILSKSVEKTVKGMIDQRLKDVDEFVSKLGHRG